MSAELLQPIARSLEKCKICGGEAELFGVVDFNKNCEEHRAGFCRSRAFRCITIAAGSVISSSPRPSTPLLTTTSLAISTTTNTTWSIPISPAFGPRTTPIGCGNYFPPSGRRGRSIMAAETVFWPRRCRGWVRRRAGLRSLRSRTCCPPAGDIRSDHQLRGARAFRRAARNHARHGRAPEHAGHDRVLNAPACRPGGQRGDQLVVHRPPQWSCLDPLAPILEPDGRFLWNDVWLVQRQHARRLPRATTLCRAFDAFFRAAPITETVIRPRRI